MIEKLQKLEIDLQLACKDEPAALWFSGGKDSVLLLNVLSELGLTFFVLRFDDGWTSEQKSLAMSYLEPHSLAAYAYAPVSGILFGNGEDLTLSTSYSIGAQGETLPVLRDIVDGDRCAVDMQFDFSEEPQPPIVFRKHILGSKKADQHYAFNGHSPMPDSVVLTDSVTLFLPLYLWTDEEVLEVLDGKGIEYKVPSEQLDTGNLSACTNCLKGGEKAFCPKVNKEIPAVEWSPTDNLRLWRAANGLESQYVRI